MPAVVPRRTRALYLHQFEGGTLRLGAATRVSTRPAAVGPPRLGVTLLLPLPWTEFEGGAARLGTRALAVASNSWTVCAAVRAPPALLASPTAAVPPSTRRPRGQGRRPRLVNLLPRPAALTAVPRRQARPRGTERRSYAA